ncbi:MAG: glycosyltransferase [Candidatus Micrarchaeota archaeon]
MISIIIPALNEEKKIASCLIALKNQDYDSEFEVIIVDAFSKDKTIEIARVFTPNIYQQRAGGPGEARNFGAQKAKYDIIAFIDADCIADPNWLHEIEGAMKNGTIGVGGVLRPMEGRFIDKFMFKLNADWWVRISAFFGLYQLYGNNCAYKKDKFLEIGGFSTKITFFEDTELSMRMKEKGKLKINPRCVVYASARRFIQTGYFKVFKQNITAFLNFTFGRPITTRYFDIIEH